MIERGSRQKEVLPRRQGGSGDLETPLWRGAADHLPVIPSAPPSQRQAHQAPPTHPTCMARLRQRASPAPAEDGSTPRTAAARSAATWGDSGRGRWDGGKSGLAGWLAGWQGGWAGGCRPPTAPSHRCRAGAEAGRGPRVQLTRGLPRSAPACSRAAAAPPQTWRRAPVGHSAHSRHSRGRRSAARVGLGPPEPLEHRAPTAGTKGLVRRQWYAGLGRAALVGLNARCLGRAAQAPPRTARCWPPPQQCRPPPASPSRRRAG